MLALGLKLSDYDILDVAAVLDRWCEENKTWPAWSDLRSHLQKRINARKPPLEHQPLRVSDIEPRALATKYGQQALREGWAASYVIDIEKGELAGFSFDDGYVEKRRKELRERRELAANLPEDLPDSMRKALIALNDRMEDYGRRLAEKYLKDREFQPELGV